MKKLLYIASGAEKSSGINIKIQGQIKALGEKYEVSIFDLSYNKGDSFLRKFYKFTKYQLKCFRFIINYDVIYNRYSPYTFLLNVFIHIIPNRRVIYFEHNTLISKELKIYGKYLALISHFISFFIIKHSNIINIVPTNEIKRELLNIGFDNKYIKVIQNGYEIPINHQLTVNNVFLEKIKIIRNNYDKVGVFVGNNFPWQGIDKIVGIFQNKKDFAIVIVGDFPEYLSKDNIYFVGSQNIETISDMYKICDFGIGAFNLSIKGMEEACALKVREYLFHGLPVLYNYYEMAEGIHALSPYLFNYKNRPNCIYELKKARFDRKKIKTIALANLSWSKLLKEI